MTELVKELPKLCINCLHSRERMIDNPDGWSRNIKCFHPTNVTGVISLVSGDQILKQYDTEAIRTNPNASCGTPGNLFEPKITYHYDTSLQPNKQAGPAAISNAAAKRIGIDQL